MDKLKSFGPRNEKSVVIEGAVKPEDGIDMHLHDSVLLRYCITRFWDFDKIIPDLYVHLQWRQTNIPIPMLQDRTLTLLNKGLFYIHGRCKDYSPIMVFDLKTMAELLEKNEIDNCNFQNIHNFFANYIIMNMLVPG